MKKVFILILTIATCLNATADDALLEEKINKVNSVSLETLGVSLTALAFLVKASPDTFLTIEYMDQEDINAIKSLESAGYITTEKVQGLPDGTHKKLQYLRVIPSYRGYEAQRCLIALEHNK